MRNPLKKFFPCYEHSVDLPMRGGWIQPEPDGVIFCVDAPRVIDHTGPEQLRGWVAAHSPIKAVRTSPGGACELLERPDVSAVHPDRSSVVGFRGIVPSSAAEDGIVHLTISLSDRDVHRIWPITCNPPCTAHLKSIRREKVCELLVCPKCRSSLERLSSEMHCAVCNSHYPYTDNYFDFLPDWLQTAHRIEPTTNVSAHEYDQVALAVIGTHHDGLVLDCGAGFRAREFPNVINYEIVPYPSTDVLGVNERLPFRDNSFDAVLSLSVLEHVRDPVTSSQEILRVLKPGGTLYCSVPFLQPMHGYPHHYFNMTTEGLKSLFEDSLRIDAAGVVESGLPIWSLTWFLRSWVDGLPDSERQEFLALKVGDLIGAPQQYLRKRYVTALSQEKNLELASSTVIIGTKTS